MSLDLQAFYAQFDDQVRGLIAHATLHAPAFAVKMQEAELVPEDVVSARDLARVPVTRKDDLVEMQADSPPFGGLLTVRPGELRRIYQSPGPIYDPEPDVEDHWRWKPAFLAAGFRPGDLVLNAFGYHLTPAGAMFEEGVRAVGCAVIPGGIGNMDQQAQAMDTLGVTGYIGLPSYLKALLEKAEELGHDPRRWPLEKAWVAAEPLPPSLRDELEGWGFRVLQGYGTAETGNLGYECEAADGFHLPEDAVVQVCDPETGEVLPSGDTGEVVVTVFSREYALIRFGTGDLSAVNLEPCKCGRPSPRLVGWLGRVGDAVKVRGMFLHPVAAGKVLNRFSEVKSFQFVVTRQEHKDNLTLRVAVDPQVDREDLSERLRGAIREGIKFRVSVDFDNPPAEDAPFIDDKRSWE